VDRRALALDTAVMAVAAWRIADAERPLGRRFSEAEAKELLKKNGLDSAERMASQPR
jgi:hypothetical protein